MGIKYKINENFFSKWTLPMAYVLGYLYADGSLEDAPYLRGKYVRVSSTDRESIIRIKRLLQSKHTVVTQKPTGASGKERYFLRIGNKRLYERLYEIGLRPNKSLTMSLPKIPPRYVPSFIRGYFDGDGCVFLEKNPKNRKLIKRMRIIFTSGSEKFLKQLARALSLYGIDGVLRQGYNRSFQLSYNTRNSIMIHGLIYKNTHGVYLGRKASVFRTYFKERAKN